MDPYLLLKVLGKSINGQQRSYTSTTFKFFGVLFIFIGFLLYMYILVQGGGLRPDCQSKDQVILITIIKL